MPRKKLKRFAELATFPNVFYDPFAMKGRWRELFFQNDHALTLELACGKGDYTLALARKFPEKNFIGVDAKGARLWTGAKTALLENLPNAAFLKGQIEQIALFFCGAGGAGNLDYVSGALSRKREGEETLDRAALLERISPHFAAGRHDSSQNR